MKIVFFGSGPFALPLAQYIHIHYPLTAVTISKPKPKGRGLRLKQPKIADWANEQNIEVFSPDDPNSDSFIRTMETLHPDIYVLASYGHILGPDLLGIPQFGGINVHPSLLPKYRGPAPIQRTLMVGDSVTGLTMILIDEKVDHGDIVFQEKISIRADDTYGSLLERLSRISTEHICSMIQAVAENTCSRSPQDHASSSYAKKISKEETVIHWDRGVDVVVNLVRALSPTPGARTLFRGRELKVLAAIRGTGIYPAGVIHVNKTNVTVGTGDGALVLQMVKPADKRTMSARDFKNGFRLKEGELMQ